MRLTASKAFLGDTIPKTNAIAPSHSMGDRRLDAMPAQGNRMPAQGSRMLTQGNLMTAQGNPHHSPNLADIWLCALHATVFSGCVTCKTHCPERCAPGRMQTLSASDVARRLEEVQSFVRAQQGLPLGQDFLQTLVSGQVTSMVRLFKQIQSPSLEDATRLVNLLQTGPWSDEDTQKMVVAVSQMVESPSKHAYACTSFWVAAKQKRHASRPCSCAATLSSLRLGGMFKHLSPRVQ